MTKLYSLFDLVNNESNREILFDVMQGRKKEFINAGRSQYYVKLISLINSKKAILGLLSTYKKADSLSQKDIIDNLEFKVKNARYPFNHTASGDKLVRKLKKKLRNYTNKTRDEGLKSRLMQFLDRI